MATEFPERARRDDRFGHMVVQDMLYFLRDAFDSFMSKIDRGSTTITNGQTSVVVTMSASRSTYTVNVTPTSDPGGRWWISNKTSTQFQINLAVAAPIAGVSFDWLVKGA